MLNSGFRHKFIIDLVLWNLIARRELDIQYININAFKDDSVKIN